MTGHKTPQYWTRPEVHHVILLGDRDTVDRAEMLEEQAAAHGAVIIASYAFDPGEAESSDALENVPAVLDALRGAISLHADVWVPCHFEDLTREEHVRRLDLTLQLNGRDLLFGPHLEPWPEDGINAVDYALRQEVHAVYALNCAVLAAAGLGTLTDEIERVLGASGPGNISIPSDRKRQASGPLAQLEAEYGPGPALPDPGAPWDGREEALGDFAAHYTRRGLTQERVAAVFRAEGHRTRFGGEYKQEAVSRLLRRRATRRSVG